MEDGVTDAVQLEVNSVDDWQPVQLNEALSVTWSNQPRPAEQLYSVLVQVAPVWPAIAIVSYNLASIDNAVYVLFTISLEIILK